LLSGRKSSSRKLAENSEQKDALLDPRFAVGRIAAAANSLIVARQSDFYKRFVCALLTFGNFGTGSNVMITP
jgi:hypothetical protein